MMIKKWISYAAKIVVTAIAIYPNIQRLFTDISQFTWVDALALAVLLAVLQNFPKTDDPEDTNP